MLSELCHSFDLLLSWATSVPSSHCVNRWLLAAVLVLHLTSVSSVSLFNSDVSFQRFIIVLFSVVLCIGLLFLFPSPFHLTSHHVWKRQRCVGCGCAWVCLGTSRCSVKDEHTLMIWDVNMSLYLYMCAYGTVCMSASCGGKQVTTPLQTFSYTGSR